MDTTQLMLAVAVFAVVWAVGYALAEWAVDEARLRRMVREGRLQTYGITGAPDDLATQIRDLRRRHQLARQLGLITVTPLPARKRNP